MDAKWFRSLRVSAGYTLVEAITVVGAAGVVTAVAAPSIIRFKATHEVHAATWQVGGTLQWVRSRAISEGLPQLVLFQKEDVVDGERSVFAQIVRDNDRSYSLTPPDDVEDFTLDANVPSSVRQYGETDEVPIYQDMVAPIQDRSSSARGSSSGSGSGSSGSSGSGSSGSGSSGSGSSGSGSGGSGGLLGGVGELLGGLLGGGSGSGAGSSGSGSSGSSGSVSGSVEPESQSEIVKDIVTNGTTFSVSSTDGVPAIAFNERGIPVSPDSPQEWGTGAGAVYITDNENAVYAAVVSPMGEVEVQRYEPVTATWR